jgi:hypothetical protein
MTQSPPRITFERVLNLLQRLQQAPDMEALADTWELFLIYHQRTWNRCAAYYRGKPFWGALENKYKSHRKVDPLLQYVHQARHADEHGLAPIAHVRPGFTTVGPGTILGGSKIVGGAPSVVAPGSTAKVEFTPTTIAAGPVVNRGDTYDPPVINGDVRPPVLAVAELAVKFYEELFREIDEAGGD